MGPVNSLRRNLQLENANQGRKNFAHFPKNAEFAVEILFGMRRERDKSLK